MIINLIVKRFYSTGASLNGRPLALPTNITLGWRSLPITNTLAYYENP
jgi:hypothetical protein